MTFSECHITETNVIKWKRGGIAINEWETLQVADNQLREEKNLVNALNGFFLIIDRWPDSCEAMYAFHAIKKMKQEYDLSKVNIVPRFAYLAEEFKIL